MPNYTRASNKFLCTGLDLHRPIDLLAAGKYSILTNVRVLYEGTITTRLGLSALTTTTLPGPVHSIRRMNNDISGANPPWVRFIGSSTNIYRAPSNSPGTPGLLDTGYSGSPFNLIPFRPELSPEPWMYVFDSAKQAKYRSDGLKHNIGIAPPVNSPYATKARPLLNVLESYNGSGGLTVTGNCVLAPDVARFSTTADSISYDSGNTGWCTVNPNVFDNNFQPGAFLVFGGTEVVSIDQVFSPIAPTTVLDIIYDNGMGTGPCTVIPATQSAGFIPNAMVKINTEIVRIISVSSGPDDSISFRCSPLGNYLPGTALTGVGSFRIYTNATFTTGSGIVANAVVGLYSGAGTGTIDRTAALNVASIGSRPTQPDDYMHISILVSVPESLVEGRIILSIETTPPTYDSNYYYKVFRPSDLLPNVLGDLTLTTTRQRAIQRSIVDASPVQSDPNYYDPNRDTFSSFGDAGYGSGSMYNQSPIDYGQGVYGVDGSVGYSEQVVNGSAQWTELRFKVSELIRVGSDKSRSLKDVSGIRFQAQTTAGTSVYLSSLTLLGGYPPDVGQQGSPFLYNYRFRSSLTGARSNPSPASRSGVNPRREGVQVYVEASADPQVDKIDIYRFGGNLPNWKYLGSFPNTTGFVTDNLSSTVLAVSDDAVFDDYQPFPVSGNPVSGLVRVCGTTVIRLGGSPFDSAWVPGNEIIINGTPYTLYASPQSANQLQLVESAGSHLSTTFFIKEPTLAGQSVRSAWIYSGQETGSFLFAIDLLNPGSIRWCKGNNPDVASDSASLEITSPSELLIRGFSHDSRNIVFSSQQPYAIFPNITSSRISFTSQPIPIGKGLYAVNGLCVGPSVWFVAKDGIYEWDGSSTNAACITDTDLFPIFPHEGTDGTATNGYYPVDFSQPDSMFLAYTEKGLIFNYVDSTSTARCLYFDLALRAWFPYTYTPTVKMAYPDEGTGTNSILLGGNDGVVYEIANTNSDNGQPIACHVRTRSDNQGDTRVEKQYGDVLVDLDSASVPVTIDMLFDNDTQTYTPAASPITNTVRSQSLLEFPNSAPVFALNIALDLQWESNGTAPILYEWQPSYIKQPERTGNRPTDWDDCGYPGAKFVQGMLTEANTDNISQPIAVQRDGGITAQTLNIQHNNQTIKPYAFTPFIAHLLRVVPSAATLASPVVLYNIKYIWEPAPELVTQYTTQGTTHDLPGWYFHRDIYIAVIPESTGVIFLTMRFDNNPLIMEGGSSPNPIPINVIGGVHQKVYIVCPPHKSKITTYSLTSTIPFRLFKKDCEVRVKSWGSEGGFVIKNPFGGNSRVDGAAI